jgi:LytS/YehU family sensor histidine kinase
MILITLIENSFKHGVMPVSKNAWINLVVEDSDKGLLISIGNSSKNDSTGEGIGLRNLESQLDHLYKDSYSMQIDRSKVNEFSVTLILNHSK